MAKFGFNTAEVDITAPAEYDPIPAGEYVLKALEAEEKETSKRDGSYIKAKFEVVKGEYAGRWIWHNFNIDNPNEKAQRIGRQQLVSWATACGKPDAEDTDKLLEKPFSAEVSIEKGTGGYKDSNRIKAFLFAQEENSKKSKQTEKKEESSSAGSSKLVNPWE